MTRTPGTHTVRRSNGTVFERVNPDRKLAEDLQVQFATSMPAPAAGHLTVTVTHGFGFDELDDEAKAKALATIRTDRESCDGHRAEVAERWIETMQMRLDDCEASSVKVCGELDDGVRFSGFYDAEDFDSDACGFGAMPDVPDGLLAYVELADRYGDDSYGPGSFAVSVEWSSADGADVPEDRDEVCAAYEDEVRDFWNGAAENFAEVGRDEEEWATSDEVLSDDLTGNDNYTFDADGNQL